MSPAGKLPNVRQGDRRIEDYARDFMGVARRSAMESCSYGRATAIYSRSLAEHRHHVAEVLQRLREFHLFLKAGKCSFHQPSVQFLGYNIESGGIRMDEGKVDAIQTWPVPSTIKELQRFLGFSNFYRRFIQNYSTITSPLTSLLQNKPKSLSWTPAANEAFENLKDTFTHAPILVHPDPQKPFIV